MARTRLKAKERKTLARAKARMMPDIERPSLVQVLDGRKGEKIVVEDDVLDIVRRLKEIDPRLGVRWNQQGGYFTIYEQCDDGNERLVTNVNQLDARLIDYFEMLAHESWDAATEAEVAEDKNKKEMDDALKEQIGEIGERLQHAMLKDKQLNKSRMWVPEKWKIGLPKGLR